MLIFAILFGIQKKTALSVNEGWGVGVHGRGMGILEIEIGWGFMYLTCGINGF
jgi:hypothetical protein